MNTMKRYFFLIFACLALTAMAQDPQTQPNEQRLLFGYLSYDAALKAMPEYAIAQQKLADLRTAYNAEVRRVEEEFNKKYESFLEGQRDFPRSILLKRQNELQQLMMQNIAFKEQGEKELKQAEVDELAPLKVKLGELLAEVAHQHGLALIINTDANACPFIEPTMGQNVQDDVQKLMETKK